MKYYRMYLLITLFGFLQLILLYINSSLVVHKCGPSGTTMADEYRMKESRNVEDNYTESLLKTIAKLKRETSMLRELLSSRDNKTTIKQPTAEITQSFEKKRKKPKGNAKLEELATIILYREKETSESCLESTREYLQKQFPDLNIISTRNSTSIGAAFNELFPKVETRYFYFLNAQHELMEQNVTHSVNVLLQDLEDVPQLDFISGSVLNKDKLEIPCYRLQLCNWTLSQRYEYKRSIDEIMICENIASSFMGRTSSVKRIFPGQKQIFDERMRKLSFTDFFLRAKNAGAISGVRPEVMVKVSEGSKCISVNITEDNLEYYQAHLPFAHKHKVFRFKNPDSQTLDLCDANSPLVGKDICHEPTAHKIMLNGGHWAYSGTFAYPYIIRNLQHSLLKMDDFFNKRGIRYFVDGGVAMGAIKMRAVLAWDSGDVDVQVYHNDPPRLYSIIESFAKEHNYTVIDRLHIDNQIQVFCVPGLRDKMGGLVSLFMNKEDSTNFIKIKTNGRWIPYILEMFPYLRRIYGASYLQHKMHGHGVTENIHCTIEGHNACLPDFRGISAREGTYNERLCNV